jgi:sugar phosphate isomerase/epimerase
MSNPQRREFLRKAFTLAGGLAATRLAVGLVESPTTALAAVAKFKLGIGTYTFRGLDVDTELAHYQKLGIRYIELSSPSFFLDSLKEDAIAPYLEKLRRAGIELLSWFAGDIHDQADLDRTLHAAKLFGVKHVSGSAEGDVLLALDRAFQRSGLQFGIHNHWFADRKFTYESPDSVLEALAKTSTAVGATLDTGHMIACGYDPTDAFLKLQKRVHIIHLKDDDVPGHNVVLGQGKANMAKFLSAIVTAGFSGLAAVEFEEGTDPFEEVRACIEYVKARIKVT